VCELNPVNNIIYSQVMEGDKYKLNIYEGDFLKENKPNWTHFDVVLGNPPYNKNKTKTGNSVWNLFVETSLKITEYLMMIHPSGWRKPESEKSKNKGLFSLMTNENHMLYLEIHNTKDGIKTFHAGTRYDWYILKTQSDNRETKIVDEMKKIHYIDLKKWKWLPNFNISSIQNLFAKENEEHIDILYSRSAYGTEKECVSSEETKEFKYPLIHTTSKSGTRKMFSNINNSTIGNKKKKTVFRVFGVSKIIFGDSGIYDVIIDLDGKYGTTEDAMSIPINSKEEAMSLKKCLLSTEFRENILKACSWGNFRIDWRMFCDFRKDFWKDFHVSEEQKDGKKEEIKQITISKQTNKKKHTVIELKQLLKEHKIKGYSKMKKKELEEMCVLHKLL